MSWSLEYSLVYFLEVTDMFLYSKKITSRCVKGTEIHSSKKATLYFMTRYNCIQLINKSKHKHRCLWFLGTCFFYTHFQ